MSLRFELCPESAWAYSQLTFDPESNCKYVLSPYQTMYWFDEHPDGMTAGCHLSCLASIRQLLMARQQIWDHGGVAQELADFWADALALLPEWPGFLRLDLDAATRDLMDDYAVEGGQFFREVLAEKEIRVYQLNALPAPGTRPPRE